ncbi:hypothetical protein ACJ41P_32880, partial [Azospirillum argentinense]
QRIDTLSQALTRFGETIHRAAADTGTRSAAEQAAAANAGPSGSSGGGAGGGSEGVVDAEFEEVDDQNRQRG